MQSREMGESPQVLVSYGTVGKGIQGKQLRCPRGSKNVSWSGEEGGTKCLRYGAKGVKVVDETMGTETTELGTCTE